MSVVGVMLKSDLRALSMLRVLARLSVAVMKQHDQRNLGPSLL